MNKKIIYLLSFYITNNMAMEDIASDPFFAVQTFDILTERNANNKDKIYTGTTSKMLEMSSIFEGLCWGDVITPFVFTKEPYENSKNILYVQAFDYKKGLAYKLVCLSKGPEKKCYLTKFTRNLSAPNNFVELDGQKYTLETILVSENCSYYIEKITQLSSSKSSQPMFEKLAEEIFEQETKI